MANPIKDIAGQRFGRLVVLEFSHSDGAAHWRCRCDCGGEKVAAGRLLRAGVTASCGCIVRERMRALSPIGQAARRVPFAHAERLGQMFDDMRKRCGDTKNRAWHNYGGRGIRVCAEWLADRRAFYAWALEHGYAPGLTIERNDVNGHYEPANCRFIPRAEQGFNTRRNQFIEWNGERLTRTEWARRLGVSPGVLLHRQSRGWSVERMLTEPVRGAD